MILALLVVLVVLFVLLPVIGMAATALISTIFVGLVIGALARLVIPGRQSLSLPMTVVAGLSGSIIGGFMGSHLFNAEWFGTLLLEVLVAVVAVVLLGGRTRSSRASR